MRDQAPAGDEAGSGQGVPWPGIALTAAIVAAMAVAVLAIHPLREAAAAAVSGDTVQLRAQLDRLGAGGVAVLAALMAIHTFVWFPAEIVDAAAGFAYGFWLALPLVLVGWVLQGLLAYAIGRDAARPLLTRFIGAARFARVERLVAGGGVTLLLATRLVPVIPFSLFSYVCGATRVPLARFVWTTAVGYIPITAIFIYLGSRLETLSPTDPVIWAGAAVLIALMLATRFLRPAADPAREAPAADGDSP